MEHKRESNITMNEGYDIVRRAVVDTISSIGATPPTDREASGPRMAHDHEGPRTSSPYHRLILFHLCQSAKRPSANHHLEKRTRALRLRFEKGNDV